MRRFDVSFFTKESLGCVCGDVTGSFIRDRDRGLLFLRENHDFHLLYVCHLNICLISFVFEKQRKNQSIKMGVKINGKHPREEESKV